MGDPTMYTDPRAPEAPRPGDVVVVVHVYDDPDVIPTPAEQLLPGRVCRLEKINVLERTPWPWACGRKIGVVHSVRRPTEAELTTYHLTHGGAQ